MVLHGFNASGTTIFTQRTITTKAVKFEEIMCLRDLETKWTQILLKNGQRYSEADVPGVIVDEITKKIMARLEVADWQGDTASGNAYINRYDGLAKIIKAASGVVAQLLLQLMKLTSVQFYVILFLKYQIH
jgi:heat shock protein HslJ